MATIGAVIGIDKYNEKEKAYRVILAQVAINKGVVSGEWQFKKSLVDLNTLRQLTQQAKFLNIAFENNSIKGTTGSLDRFKSAVSGDRSVLRPMIILSELRTSEDRLIGYKVVNYDGEVKNIINKELLAYCKRMTKANGVPIQNAIYVPTEGQFGHIKSYPHSPFIKEILNTNKNKYAEKPVLNVKKNEKTLSKLDEIYTKDQIAELKLGRQSGLDIRVYANPSLTANQMRVLRGGLAKGLNVKLIASPDYKVDCMKAYLVDLEDGLDIRSYLSPKYNIGQISELSIASELGLDISKLSNPKLSAVDMQEIRERLQNNIYKETLVKSDGSWV